MLATWKKTVRGHYFTKSLISLTFDLSKTDQIVTRVCSITMNSDAMEPPLALSEKQQDDLVMYDIDRPNPNDVLCGRGVSTNRYPGNECFRSLVGLNKVRAPPKHSGFLSSIKVF
jgi:hypothetical protein